MSPREPHPQPAPDAAGPAAPPAFAKRLTRRVLYMTVAGCISGAVVGHAAGGRAGAAVGAATGAGMGVLLGVLIGGFAWVLESPAKRAVRGGGLLAAAMGLPLAIGVAATQGWGGWANALTVGLMAAGMGAAGGGLLGAFLAWLAGPIFREMVQDMDRGGSPRKRRPWW
jgi:hypothetical protein